jgi:hypothetical protein
MLIFRFWLYFSFLLGSCRSVFNDSMFGEGQQAATSCRFTYPQEYTTSASALAQKADAWSAS